MKTLLRVALLLATLLFVIQCSCTKPVIRTIQTNTDSAIAVELNPDSRGNGVILICDKDMCTVLTAAHLCNPYIIIDELVDEIVDGTIPQLMGEMMLVRYAELVEDKKFCSGEIVLDGGKKRVAFTPMYIDFERDIMLGGILLPGKESTVHLSTTKVVKPGTELYTVVIAPLNNDKVVLFSRAGLTRKAFMLTDTEKKNGKIYLQADFSVGPGASGAPVFLTQGPNSRGHGNMLVGLLGAQMIDGDPFAPIKATFVVTPEDIRDSYQQYAEDNNDHKLDWPYCHGEKHLCDLVHGKVSLLETLRRRNVEEASSEGATKVPQPTDDSRGGSLSPGDAGVEDADQHGAGP